MTEKEAVQKILLTLRAEEYPENYLRELCEFLSLSYLSETELSQKKEEDFQLVIEFLQQQKPVEYIVGHAHFYGYEFFVNSDVLIPRPDSESLITESLSMLEKLPQNATILDIGTGSGALIISLAKELARTSPRNSYSYLATDVSSQALSIAKLNATKLQLEGVDFQNVDVFPRNKQDEALIPESDDVFIISNPPYIAKESLPNLPDSVKNYEPIVALVEQNDFIEKFDSYVDLLRSKGKKVHLAVEYSKNGNMIQRSAFNHLTGLRNLLEI